MRTKTTIFGVVARTGSLNMKRIWIGLLLAGLVPLAMAQQQFDGVCSRVKIEILQELSLERIGFLATLEVTNNDGKDPITDFSAQLTFTNPNDPSGNEKNNAANWFFIRAPEMENINNVDGAGIIAPTQKAVVRWFIIPKPGAGGSDPAGIRYRVGCNLSARIKGAEIPGTVLFAVPDMITVQPQPILDITYFQPRDVQADDPFTEAVEAPVPFILGVLVRNVGYGNARSVMIRSEQPKIAENLQHLLIVPRLLGVRVMDSPLDRTSLTVNIGDLEPGETRKAAWDMITTLSGEFIEFKASYTHAPEFGGEETSLITNLVAHFIAKEVLNDQAGRDGILDFLADTDRDDAHIPDALYESEGQILPVNYLPQAELGTPPGPGQALVVVDSDRSDWCYMRVDDPQQAKLPIESVVRDDGRVINTNNYWTNIRYQKYGTEDVAFNQKLTYLNIFDLCNLGTNTYTVTYGGVPSDTNAPVTTIEFAGEMVNSTTNYFITDQTQIFFLSTDESPVSMFYSITNAPFQPAYPFWITDSGDYTVSFYATDSSGNTEATNTVRVVVNGEAPSVQQFAKDEASVLLTGDALSIRPGATRISFAAAANSVDTDARIDIFRGIVPFVTLSNVPASTVDSSAATLYVGGEQVDFYKYRLDGGDWAAEQDVLQPIGLSGLTNGSHQVDVLGRPRYGSYPSASQAVSAEWTVDLSGGATRIAGVPATPTRQATAQLTVSGSGITDYRWTVDSNYLRAEEPVATPFLLEKLSDGIHTVGVIGKTGGTWEDTNDLHSLSWTVDSLYGYGYSADNLVRSMSFTNIGSSVQSWIWDGKNESGSDVLPGWYTVRLTLVDELSQTNFATTLVQVEDLFADNTVLANPGRGPNNPYARGRWVVWEDQSDGSLEVYARNTVADAATTRQLTSGDFSQKNPKTDGHYAVWQGRASDGSWDLYMADLDNTGAVTQVTATLGVDEINPCIEWPWVVFQTRAASRPGDSWQLEAINLLTGARAAVWPGPADQLDPDIEGGRVVWQDWRDVGPGEIYFQNLETGEQRRVTTNTLGQYHPVISGHWIVWQDNRDSQVDIFGYDLLRNREVQITDTPENESDPFIDGEWICCLEDSQGAGLSNIRMVHLSTLATMPLTRDAGVKSHASINGRQLVWMEQNGTSNSVVFAELPALQAVFQTMNAVPVTPAMVNRAGDAFTLLERWNKAVGVQAISRYSALVPTLVKQTATWDGGAATGDNFTLAAGDFIWLGFDAPHVADMGDDAAGTLSLSAGVSVFGYADFPQPYSAYQMVRQLGLDKIRAIRMLDTASGQWWAAEVCNGALIGRDFKIPSSAVIWVDMKQAVNDWRPL